jgi:hypothetical protein
MPDHSIFFLHQFTSVQKGHSSWAFRGVSAAETADGIFVNLLFLQVVLEFPHAFWEDSADFFGAAVPGGPGGRGRCFMFWNLQPVSGKPILISLVSGKAAYVSASLQLYIKVQMTELDC